MIDTNDVINAAAGRGIGFCVRAPSSLLTPPKNAAISSDRARQVDSISQGEAVALEAGAWLAGQQTAVTCTNSRLRHAVNILLLV